MKHTYTFSLKSLWLVVNRKLFILSLISALFLNINLNAAVTVTKAGGGTGISADMAANALSPGYTTLSNLIISEGAINDFAASSGATLTLIVPTGWSFNTFSSVSAIAATGNDISTAVVSSVTSSIITIQLTIGGVAKSDVLTVSGIEVRANDGGNVSGPVNITRGGNAIISGCVIGANLGSLSQLAGSINKLVITLPGQTFYDVNSSVTSGNTGSANDQTAGSSFVISKIRACDQFFNVVTTYAGVKSLTFSGPSNGLTSPSYITNVSFASGVSSTVLTTTLKNAELTTITVSDGITSGPASASINIKPGVVSNFLVESSSGGIIGTQITGISFNIKVTARDANNNACTSGLNTFFGTVVISSSGSLVSGNGTTASFAGGVLLSHNVIISNQGNFSVTATKSGSTESGSSNSFAVNYPASNISGITPSCITTGGSAFVIIVNGNNFVGSSVVRFNGSDRTTTFVNANQLTANIFASDIASASIYQITVYTPSAGTTAPRILNTNTTSTVNVSICQGSTYILPDGVPQNTTGTYYSHIPNTAGCDSSIVINLTVNTNPTRTENISVCTGTNYQLPDGSLQSSPGTYYSIVTNPGGCDSIITTVLSNFQTPILTSTPIQINCFGGTGSVVLNTYNGVAPYSYGSTQTVNLTAGTYNYSVTDANGCTTQSSSVISPEPSQLILAATPNQILCSGGSGSVNLNASGGMPLYSYGSTQTTNLTAGTYYYQVTDNNGCVANATVTINAAPTSLSAVTSVVNTPCGSSVGSASVTITGGVSPYTYSWNTSPVSTTRSITGLSTGNYIVTATDNNSCSVSQTASITNSNSTSFSITGTTGICPGGSTTLCATSGFPSYSWSTGETTQCITVNTADTFYVTVINAQGCSGIKSIVTNNSSFPTCNITGGTLCQNGTLILRAPTGYPYYIWSNGARTNYSSVRSAGTYTVTLRNADNCPSTCSYTVNSPLRITVSKIDGKCSNGFKGSASVSASAGNPPYSYLWSNGDTTSSIGNLAAGSYTIRVTDAGGCVSAFTTLIYSNKTTYDYSTITSNFNNNIISPGTYIWFSAVANIIYTGNYPVTINFTNQNITSGGLNLIPANSKLIITNAVSQATTTFTGGEWVTTAPPNLTGNYFVSGYAHDVVSPIAANLYPVKWRGVWASSSSCVSAVNWKWSAAVYSGFTTDKTLINIKPVDDIGTSVYSNSDYAGTPENFKAYCIAGARSIGGADYTGTYSSIVNRLPCAVPDACGSVTRYGLGLTEESASKFKVNVYPNPFNTTTNIEFVNVEKSGHLNIDIFSVYGKKLKTIFNSDIESGVMYTVEFDAGDLPDGIYIYRLMTKDEDVRGKLILKK